LTSILMITNLYPPNHLGGYELLCRDAVDRFRAHGHDVEVLTSNVRLEGAVQDAGLDDGVRRELELYWDDHQLRTPPLLECLAIERRNQAATQRALDGCRPDVVCVWNMGALSLGVLQAVVDRARPIVTYVCDDWLLYGPDLDRWTKRFDGRPRLGRIVSRVVGVPTGPPDLGADATHCFISERTRSRATELGRWQLRRSTVIYSGIDRTDFPESPVAERRWDWRLLYVGRIDPRKGIETAIRATAELPPSATLDVVGRGDEVELRRLEGVVEELDLQGRVRFHGDVPRASLVDEYRRADVLLFPSTWEEPFGLVPIEAMACATPVVASPVGGSVEFLWDERNCLAVPPADAAAVAAAVRRLADDAALRERLVEGGLHTAAQLDVDRTLDALERWLLWAVDQSRPMPADLGAPQPPPHAVRR
jgi:glycosyltransferase involved in cell wall biosynthesis